MVSIVSITTGRGGRRCWDVPEDGNVNSQLSVSYKYDCSFIIWGFTVGVFTHIPTWNSLNFSLPFSRPLTPTAPTLSLLHSLLAIQQRPPLQHCQLKSHRRRRLHATLKVAMSSSAKACSPTQRLLSLPQAESARLRTLSASLDFLDLLDSLDIIDFGFSGSAEGYGGT